MKQFYIIFVACFCAMPALSQGIVGRAIVEGRTVNLYADNTWSFADTVAPDCQILTSCLSFCGDRQRWQSSTPISPDVTAAFRHDSKHYGQVIVEEIGTDQGLTVENTREFILGFAADANAGLPPVVLSTTPVSIGPMQGETLVYSFAVNGISTVYVNTVLLDSTTLIQLITYQVGGGYSIYHTNLHAEFLDAAKISP